MARIRTIKPEFFTSEDIVSLIPMARLLYIATWCEADKEGRLVWKPKTFKLRYFPGDSCDVDALCDELVKAGLVKLYGDGLAFIPAFQKHQHINPRESASVLPEPDAWRRVATRHSRDSDAQGGREGKGRSKDASSRDGSAAPPDVAASLKAQDLQAEGVDPQKAADWLTLRKAKRLPLTVSAWDDTKAEGFKAGLTPAETVATAVKNNWCGFKASWLASAAKPAAPGKVDIYAGLAQ